MFTSHGTIPQETKQEFAVWKTTYTILYLGLTGRIETYEKQLQQTRKSQFSLHTLQSHRCFAARTLFLGQFSFFPRRRKSGSCLSAYLPLFFPGSVSVSKCSVLFNSLIVKILAILYTHPLFGAESVFVSLCRNNQHKKIVNIVCEPHTHTQDAGKMVDLGGRRLDAGVCMVCFFIYLILIWSNM